MKTWAEQFRPISAKGWDIREGQESLGNAIIQTIEQGGILVGEASTGTGKSLATSIPLIEKIKQAKASGRVFRGIISTETITLQTQLAEKDLPFLQDTYGGFEFQKLLGRSNYLCLNRADEEVVGSVELQRLVNNIKKYRGMMVSGEYADVCKALGKVIDRETWSKITGSSDYCSSNDCSPEDCYGSLARQRALAADIVVINHALLAVDFDMKSSGRAGPASEGILGPYEVLIVDEAHKLEEVLSSQWTETASEREITDHSNRLVQGLSIALGYNKVNAPSFSEMEALNDEFLKFFGTSLKFFAAMADKFNQKWDGSETAMCLHYLTNPDPKILKLMDAYETIGPSLMETMVQKMEILNTYLTKSIAVMMDQKVKGKQMKDVRKALTSAKYLSNISIILNKSMQSEDAVIAHNGTMYGVVADGWTRKKNDERSMTIRCFPIDVSNRAAKMWGSTKATILVSATLTDLTENNFRYFKRSLGVNECREIKVSSPFSMIDQQLVYITAKQYTREDEDTEFSIEELIELVKVSNGRALILFTSRREIDYAQKILLQHKIAGNFPFTLLTQEKDSDKSKLVEEFKMDTHSVLLGLKSMFTGIDIPGESLSIVIMCRFPLPRWSTENKMKVKYWGRNGFRQWYSREALTVFQQAAGRLIRSTSCVGAIALIDQRAYDRKTNVFETASLGVSSLGSRVTHSLTDVGNHLRSVA